MVDEHELGTVPSDYQASPEDGLLRVAYLQLIDRRSGLIGQELKHAR